MKINIKLKNCYGIKSLEEELDFGCKRAFSIYASNGTMKTSFANTFSDISENNESQDKIYQDRETIRAITIGGAPMQAEEVFVVKPYVPDYHPDNIARLLVNDELKKKYEASYEKIRQLKDNFLASIIDLSGHKSSDLAEKEISKVLQQGNENKFFDALHSVNRAVKILDEIKYEGIEYRTIFDEKTEELFKKQQFTQNVQQYVEKYNELLEQSNFFKKGIFNHTQATDVASSLEKQGFFNAKHYVTLMDKEGKPTEIKSKQELIQVIDQEKALILDNEELKELFKLVDDNMKKNQDLRSFREYLSNNPQVISQLSNPEDFKATLWKEYFKALEAQFNELLEAQENAEANIKKIRDDAKKERGDWDNVISDFNNRFFVPFTVTVGNKIDTMLNDAIPVIAFQFEGKEVEKRILEEVLSQGERRALYILNILFAIEVRKKQGGMSLLVIDDIADSFDYKNKYAIVQYLRELSNHSNFYLIILTHNFDFHRTVGSRLDMHREHKIHAIKSGDKIQLRKEHYQNNPIKHWGSKLDNPKMLLAAIPMIRNLLEYSGKEQESNSMTSFLHMKNDTITLKLENLKDFLGNILPSQNIDKIANEDKIYYKFLLEQCDELLGVVDELKLEEKVALSIGIRLKAEAFMIKKINDSAFVDGITSNQTNKLLNKYKELFSTDIESNKILERVNLMTPENIHLNSFMYEPLIDMGSNELLQLYKDITTLESTF